MHATSSARGKRKISVHAIVAMQLASLYVSLSLALSLVFSLLVNLCCNAEHNAASHAIHSASQYEFKQTTRLQWHMMLVMCVVFVCC